VETTWRSGLGVGALPLGGDLLVTAFYQALDVLDSPLPRAPVQHRGRVDARQRRVSFATGGNHRRLPPHDRHCGRPASIAHENDCSRRLGRRQSDPVCARAEHPLTLRCWNAAGRIDDADEQRRRQHFLDR
jgi:hypothetical protein